MPRGTAVPRVAVNQAAEPRPPSAADGPSLSELAGRLAVAAEALGALGAAARLRVTGERAPVELAAALAEVVAALEAEPALGDAPAAVLSGVAGMAGTLLAQAAALADRPIRSGSWQPTDVAILEGSGQASIAFAATMMDRFLPLLGDLGGRLSGSGAAFLDVGVGAGHLAMALCRRLPELVVVGLDPWEPGIERARANIAAAGLAHRIHLRRQGVEAVDDVEAFDLAWVPLSFIPAPALDAALPKLVRALRPGGWLIVGRFAGLDRLSSALADLRTLRSGGAIHDDAALRVRLESLGLVNVAPLPRGSLGLMSCLAGARRPST